jgi:hypothetical protein
MHFELLIGEAYLWRRRQLDESDKKKPADESGLKSISRRRYRGDRHIMLHRTDMMQILNFHINYYYL